MLGFWIFMLIMDLLIPAAMIGFGKIFVNKPPEKINSLYGYRTPMSMKNKDTWDFAHKYFGRLWLRFGAVMLLPSVALMLIAFGKDIDTIGLVGEAICFIQLVPMLLPVFMTEAALKKVFDRDGIRKSD